MVAPRNWYSCRGEKKKKKKEKPVLSRALINRPLPLDYETGALTLYKSNLSPFNHDFHQLPADEIIFHGIISIFVTFFANSFPIRGCSIRLPKCTSARQPRRLKIYAFFVHKFTSPSSNCYHQPDRSHLSVRASRQTP